MNLQKNHKMRGLQCKVDVTHLRKAGLFEIIPDHEQRSLRPLASSRSCASPAPCSFHRTLQCGVLRPAFRMSETTCQHSLCQTDLARGVVRHRRLFAGQAGGSLSFGFSRSGGQIDLGRSQRNKEQVSPGGSGQNPHAQNPDSLRGRRSLAGLGEDERPLIS